MTDQGEKSLVVERLKDERKRAETAEDRAKRLVEKLRTLGIDPEA